MSLTLVEAYKLYPYDQIRSAVIELYAQNSDILRTLPFDNITGGGVSYNREETLPGIGFRGVNETYTESTGIVNPLFDPLVIAGGYLDIDMFILKTRGANQREIQEAMKVKALALAWTKTFIKGDQSSSPKEFDGLQVRIVGNQLIAAGATSGGDALSLDKLDEAIDASNSATGLVMNKAMRRKLTTASRTATVGGDITRVPDEFGRLITKYNDLPILIADEDNEGNQILPFTEANPGGGAAASTSIYVVSMMDGMMTGIQNSDAEVVDLGELQTTPKMRTKVEWLSGLAIYDSKAAVRLHGIKNAAVVA